MLGPGLAHFVLVQGLVPAVHQGRVVPDVIVRHLVSFLYHVVGVVWMALLWCCGWLSD